ncbi:MAG TPA: GMC family oxidoreductase [Chloroflexota bacterium]|nr:GMC family oxidoreductase [Chloroflexota bacterium]
MTEDIADVCLIGVGAVGGILAKQLASAGLKVVGFERGPQPQIEDYAPRDSIKFTVRQHQLDWVKDDPITFRTAPTQAAALRYTTSPLNLLGGALLHWTGQASRFFPADFKVYSNEVARGLVERAGADLDGYDVVDWPLSYDDLEPHYERFEWEFGVSGRSGISPFEAPRQRGYPLPPLRRSARMEVFAKACQRLGYHPFDSPSGILSQPYRPPEPYDTRMPARPACVYCGHCNWYGCHVHAKAATLYTAIPVALATGNFDLRTRCKVTRIETGNDGQASGVSYIDAEGQADTQQARVVIVAAFVFENVRLLLLSGLANSSGMLGKCILGHGDVKAVGTFDDFVINGFIGPGSAAMRVDDFNSNNFDHTGLGFIRGGTIGTSGGGAPVERIDVAPPGMRRWGKEFKDYFLRAYSRTFELNMQAETLPHPDNTVDLDSDRRDRWGLPLPRVTFTFHENERRLQRFLAGIGEGIMRETGAETVWTELPKPAPNRWAGGTRMGSDPARSVVNEYCQAHDVPNLFVVGSSVFPTMGGYPPTATISALAYRTAEHIIQQREWFR